MSRADFSPGPWRVVFTKDEINVHDASDDVGGDWIATTACGNLEPQHWKGALADAHLIASAPDLYAAVVYAVPLVEKWCHTQGDNAEFHAETLAPLRAALAKARGEQ